jgi:hypothetical protein
MGQKTSYIFYIISSWRLHFDDGRVHVWRDAGEQENCVMKGASLKSLSRKAKSNLK